MENQKTVLVFCANCQEQTDHTINIDDSNEIVLTCSVCNRFIKLPAGTDADGLKAYIEAHTASNLGQVTQESIEAKKAELIAGLTKSK